MNPYLERKRQLNEQAMSDLDAAGPVARAEDSPYPEAPPTPMALAAQAKPQGQELARGLSPAQGIELDEQPMEPEQGRPPWHGLLDLIPGAVSGFMHLGGKGTAETRAQGYRFMDQAREAEDQDQRRVAASKLKARDYNNQLAQRRQERARQASQDTIAAEDRSRKMGKEDLEAGLAASDRDPKSPKNVTLQQAIAKTYPEVWAQLTPEQQAAVTTENVGDTLGLPIKEAAQSRASQRTMEEERSKQKAEKDYFTPGGGVGGGAYAALYGMPPGAPAPAPVPGEPPSPTPAIPADNNPYAKELLDLYGGDRAKVPPIMMAQARSLYNAAQAGRPDKELIALHDKMIDDVYKQQEDTKTRERQVRLEQEAQAKADKQQDAQYAQQRNMRSIDKVRAKLVRLKKAIEPYLDENGNLKGDIPGGGVTGNLPEPFQLALTKEGKQIMRLKKELLDTRLREATGANAPPSELKTFQSMGGIGTWDTDEDMIAGIQNAEAILDQQEAYLDANFVDASIRFHERMAEKEAKKAQAQAPAPKGKATIQGDTILLPNGGTAPNTPANREKLGL